MKYSRPFLSMSISPREPFLFRKSDNHPREAILRDNDQDNFFCIVYLDAGFQDSR